MLPMQVITVFLVAVAMALTLAHALEHPGKMRLSREYYLATQTIYYPGFTIGGGFEALGVLAALGLVLLMPRGSAPFWWSLAGFLALAVMHGVFWTVTQPVNRYWAANFKLSSSAHRFFGVGGKELGANESPRADDWERQRDKWEYSHIVRAVFAAIGMICVTIAIVLHGS
jgi:hypothetical protein